MRTDPELKAGDPLAAGREALSRGQWEEARMDITCASIHSPSHSKTCSPVSVGLTANDSGLVTIGERGRNGH